MHSFAVEAVVYRGVDPSSPIDGTPSFGFASGVANVTAGSVTTTGVGDRLVMLQGGAGNTGSPSWSASGMTEEHQDATALIVGGIADQIIPTPGATGSRTSTLSATGATTTLAGVLIALKQPPPAVLYFHHDQLGSTRVLTDISGNVAATYSYDAYGNISPGWKTGSATTPLQYAGQFNDAESGFQYLRARFYDPAVSAFLSRDPLIALTQQGYGYSGSDPLNGGDPTGLWCILGHNPDGSCRGHTVAKEIAVGAVVIAGVACYASLACGAAVTSAAGAVVSAFVQESAANPLKELRIRRRLSNRWNPMIITRFLR